MKLFIDTKTCRGQGVCTGIRPDIFDIGDDETVRLRREDFTEADRQDLEDAVFLCPTLALRLESIDSMTPLTGPPAA
jgi:ferredoxin